MNKSANFTAVTNKDQGQSARLLLFIKGKQQAADYKATFAQSSALLLELQLFFTLINALS